MRQDGIGEVSFVATRDPFVCMTVVGVTGRVAMAPDQREVQTMLVELVTAMLMAFGGEPMSIDNFLTAYLPARCRVSSRHKLPTSQEIRDAARRCLHEATLAEVDAALDRLGATRYEGGYVSDHPIEVL